jgi:molybdopterin biosynthesis enzyme
MPYASYHSTDEWIEGYCLMVNRNSVSPKLSDAEKAEKLEALKGTNVVVTTQFDSFTNIKLKGEIVKAGGSITPPKPEPLPPTGSELNEPIF